MPAEPPVSTTQRQLGGLVKHSAIYGAAPFLRQVISIGMHRLYTGWLGAAGIGVKEVVDFWLIAMQQLLGQNVLSAMVRFYFDRTDESERRRVVSSCTLLLSLVAWTVCGIAYWFSDELQPLMLAPGEIGADELKRILQLTFLLIPFQLGTLSGFFYLQILKRSRLYTLLQTGKLLFEVALNFYLMGSLQLGVRGFLISMLAGEALTSIALCGWMFVQIGPRIDWKVLRPILVYAAPLVPMGFCQLALHQVDRRLLLGFTDQATTGIYGHGYKISYLTTAMMLGPFLQIWQPFIYGVENKRERASLVARVSTYAMLAITSVSFIVILFGRQAAIMLAKDETLWEAYKIIPLVAGGYVFWALYQVSQIPLFIAKRTARLLFINIVAVVLNVSMNLWLIPRYGFVGAGITTFATFGLLSVMGMIASRSEAHVPFELGRISLTVLCVIVAGALALGVDEQEALAHAGFFGGTPSKAAGLIGLWLTLWLGVLRREERVRFRGWIAEHWPRRG